MDKKRWQVATGSTATTLILLSLITAALFYALGKANTKVEILSKDYARLSVESDITNEAKDLYIKTLEDTLKKQQNYTLTIYKDLNSCTVYSKELIENMELLRMTHEKQTPSFIKIAKNVSQAHEYDIELYNCVDFTEKYLRKVRDAGYISHKQVVILDCPTSFTQTEKNIYCFDRGTKIRHALAEVIIYVDPTTGVFIEPDNYPAWGLD